MPPFLSTNRHLRIVLLGLASALVLTLARAHPALAHANLVRATPAPNAILDEAPGEVTIWFTEPLEPQFSRIEVLDGNGQRVDNGDSAVSLQDPTMVTVTLPEIDVGTYTVVWSNVSTVDGHKVRGSYVFSVGQPIEAAATTEVSEPLLQSPLEPVFRWLTLLSIIFIVGGLIFHILVLRPAVQDAGLDQELGGGAESLQTRLSRFNWIFWALLLGVSTAHLLLQAAIAYELPLPKLPLGTLLHSTSWGRLWLWRLVLLLVMAVFLWLAGRQNDRDSEHRNNLYEMLALIAGLGILLTLSLSSHAAATLQIQSAAIVNDYIHLLAATVWAGGLFQLLLVLPLVRTELTAKQRRVLLAAAVPRFSRLAIVSVALLTVTGMYSSWAQVTVPGALRTPYGRTLLAKLGLFALIMLLAAANLLWVRSRLTESDQTARLHKLIGGEAALLVLVLLLVGLLTSLEPARQVASRLGIGQQVGLAFEDSVEGTAIELLILPGQVGPNEMLISLTDRRGEPIDNADDVSLRVSFLEADLGDTAVSTRNLGDGRYQAEEVMLGLTGPWQLALNIRRPDAFDARTAFRFEIEPATAGGSAAIAPAPAAGRQLWATELALLGLAVAAVGLAGLRRGRRRQAAIIAPGIAAVVAAVFIFMLAPSDEQTNAQTREVEPVPSGTVTASGNPFLPDASSLAAGQSIYEEHCMICHGLTGHGDGPRSAGIDAVDIIEHVPLHTDLEYFEIVPAHRDRGDLGYSTSEISEEDIWHLVNYLHAFESDQLLAEEYFVRARDMAEQGDTEAALPLLDQAIELSPRFVQALLGRGIIAMDQGDMEQAIADLSRAITLDPSHPDGYYYRAEVRRLTGQPEAAIVDYTEAISHWPDHSDALYARGLLQANAGAPAEAITDLQRYLDLEPQSADRAAIESLIAQLQSEAAGQAAPQAASATLEPADLPAGFEQTPPVNLGLAVGDSVAIGTTVASSFAFGHGEHFELLWGYTTMLPGQAEQLTFDSLLNQDDLVGFLSAALAPEDVLDVRVLPVPYGVGDTSAGVTAVFNTGGRQSRVDTLAFRQGKVGMLLFLAYGDGELPSISLDELAVILSERVGR